MQQPDNIVITALGALMPVGQTAEQSVAAIHAGIGRISEHAYFTCTPDDPEWDDELALFVSDVPVIDPFLDGEERLIQLALPALTELMGKAKFKREYLESSGFMLSLPDAEQLGEELNINEKIIPEIFKRTGLQTFKLWKKSQLGHSGIFSLLKSATDKLRSGELQYCVVGGVDSYLLEKRLDYLDEKWRIRSERNVDGFIPGEGSVMLLLEKEASAKQRGMPILARLGNIGEGTEGETIESKKNSTGTGLTEAVLAAVGAQETPQFENIYCSLNGESYFAFEWGLIVTRLSNVFAYMKNLYHPAEYCGDTGAATGGVLVMNAIHNLNSDQCTIPQSLLWTSSNNGNRMALTLLKGEG